MKRRQNAVGPRMTGLIDIRTFGLVCASVKRCTITHVRSSSDCQSLVRLRFLESGRFLGKRVFVLALGGGLLGGSALGSDALGGCVLGSRALGGRVLGGRALGDRLLRVVVGVLVVVCIALLGWDCTSGLTTSEHIARREWERRQSSAEVKVKRKKVKLEMRTSDDEDEREG